MGQELCSLVQDNLCDVVSNTTWVWRQIKLQRRLVVIWIQWFNQPGKSCNFDYEGASLTLLPSLSLQSTTALAGDIDTANRSKLQPCVHFDEGAPLTILPADVLTVHTTTSLAGDIDTRWYSNDPTLHLWLWKHSSNKITLADRIFLIKTCVYEYESVPFKILPTNIVTTALADNIITAIII